MLWKERKRIWCGLPWTFTVYSFDEERIFVDTGFFNKRQDEIRMYRVLDITVTRKFGQRLFGMGSIQLKTSDKTMGDFEIKNIKNVMDVKMQLSDLIEANREKKRVVSREFMSSNDADDFELQEDGLDEE
ncbi:MAG: PH domain-containing protein [Lachnospiraceae bacterium]|nr:PH domain-containing protein [Lachnospiraceae bacterium]